MTLQGNIARTAIEKLEALAARLERERTKAVAELATLKHALEHQGTIVEADLTTQLATAQVEVERLRAQRPDAALLARARDVLASWEAENAVRAAYMCVWGEGCANALRDLLAAIAPEEPGGAHEADHDYLHSRLTRKYDIRKADGSPTDPDAQYFVLRIDEDPNARQALVAYAASVRPVNLQFSDDLLIWLRDVMDEGQIGTGDEWDDLFQGVHFTAGLLGHAVAGDPVGRPAPAEDHADAFAYARAAAEMEPAVEIPPAPNTPGAGSLYRKRPVAVRAVRCCERREIETLEGTMTASPGDWIITGVQGEVYPIKDAIFRETYVRVEPDKQDPAPAEPPAPGTVEWAETAPLDEVEAWVSERGYVMWEAGDRGRCVLMPRIGKEQEPVSISADYRRPVPWRALAVAFIEQRGDGDE